jgi:hypothetical protein
MLVFPSLGTKAEISQNRLGLRMSVELDNLSGIQKEVNTFLPPLRIFTGNPESSGQ